MTSPPLDLRGQWVLPGFVDMHVHGGGGASFTEGTGDDARTAAEFHRAHGSTSMLASLVTAPLAELEARAAMLAGLADDGLIAGLHLEGPFLSPARRGAQDPRHMLAPDVAVFERLHAAARGHLRVITLAPELPGAARVIEAATRAGVTVAIGHTDATADVTLAAVDAGATHATHLFNGMRPLHHREPGAVGALLDRDEVTCEVIADGVHLNDIAIRLAARVKGPGRLVLVSDAMAAAGMPDGSYRLGSMRVTVTGGVARLLEDPAGPGRATGPGRAWPGRPRRDRRLHRHPGRRGPARDSRGPARPRRGRRREHHPGPRPGPRRPHRRPEPGPVRGPGRLRRRLPPARGDAPRRVAARARCHLIDLLTADEIAALGARRGDQPPLRTEPVSGPVDELTSQTTVRTPACQAFWLG